MAETQATAQSPSSVEVSPPSGAMAQLSYSGTPRLSDGTTRPDDYVPELLDPVRRMMVFEEMRAADGAVNTAIDARRQEINAANWVLSTDDTANVSAQVLEFAEDNVYPVLDDLLRLLGGGALQYGFGAVEPVFGWADKPVASNIARETVARSTQPFDGRRIVLKKLAHLRQRTVHTFRITDTGELTEVEQYVFNGASFLRRLIPGDKLLIWTYDKQGDDYWGVPPARHCYKAWSFKSQIERLNLLGFDRFGVGTPVAEEGEGWTELERTRLAKFLSAWRSGENSFLMHPSGGKIALVSGDGKMMMSALEWVRYYDLAIAKTYLTQQTELGSTAVGARALGETFLEQMGGLVQADCEELASLINERLLKPLVDWNFGPQASYPKFEPSERVTFGGGVGQVLQQLIVSGAIHPRPEDESFLRDALGLPSVEVKTLQDEATNRTDGGAGAAQSGNPGGGGVPVKKPLAIAATRALSLVEGAPTPAARGTSYRTDALGQWEQTVLRPDVLVRDLDLATSRLAGEVKDALAAIDADLERQASALGANGAEALSAGVRTIAVPARLRTTLRSVLLEAAQRARAYGDQAVRNEVQRQIGPDGIGPSRDGHPLFSTTDAPGFYARMVTRIRALVLGEDPTADPTTARDLHLAAEVDRAVEEEVSRRETSIRSAILTALAQAAGAVGAVLAGIVSTASKTALIGLSTGRTESNVQGVVNVGFGIGRADAASALQTPTATSDTRSGLQDAAGTAIELVAKIYSAVMDMGTCDECAKWDGAEFPIDYPEDYTGVQAPNPRCFGGYSKCRCVWIYITSRESIPLIPSAKGPAGAERGGVAS